MDWPVFDRYLVTLRLTRPAGFRPYHGGAVMGLLCAALGEHLPQGVIPLACEGGRVRYEAGEAYRLGFTLVGPSRELLGKLVDGLVRIGRTSPSRQSALPALAGNFGLERLQALRSADAGIGQVAPRSCDPLRVRLLAPLRMELPRSMQKGDDKFFTATRFPVAVFLSRLWRRAFTLGYGREPTETDRAASCPPLPAAACLVDAQLCWLDTDMSGDRHFAVRPRSLRGHGTHTLRLGGLVGTAAFIGIDSAWFPLLALGQALHAGQDTHYGFGRYVLEAPTRVGGAVTTGRGLRGPDSTAEGQAHADRSLTTVVN